MDIYRIFIKTLEGRIGVRDKTWSQLCELLTGLTKPQIDDFWAKRGVDLPTGERIVFDKQV